MSAHDGTRQRARIEAARLAGIRELAEIIRARDAVRRPAATVPVRARGELSVLPDATDSPPGPREVAG